MPSQSRMRDMDEYEQEDYDEYEEYASEEEAEEEEEEEEEAPPSQEQQEFLKLREKLKEKYRQKFKKEAVKAFGRSQLQDRKRTATSDNFGSFFGPSQPVIAPRVLDERRSIQETQHIISRNPTGSSGNVKETAYTSSEKHTVVHKQQPKIVNEVKKKAQTLKDMRDYSFLLSDDTDFPDAKEEQKPVRKTPASNFDGRSDQAPSKSKLQTAKPARSVPNGYGLKHPAAKNPQSQARVGIKYPADKNPQPQTRVGPKYPASKNPQLQSRVAPGNGANIHKPATSMPRKIDNPRNGTERTIMQRPLPSKVPAQTTGTSKPVAKISKDSYMKSKPPAAAPHSAVQKNHYPEQRKPSQSLNNIRSVPNKPLPSSKSQPPKKIPPRDSNEDRLKKKPMKRRLDDDDDEDAIGMIRKMFGYNPAKYSGVDDDVSDMEADFREIQREERMSAKFAKQEDEEQLRLIEEEERRERMRKKQKLKR